MDDSEVARALGELSARSDEWLRGYQRLREDMIAGFEKLTTAVETHAKLEAGARHALEGRVRGLERFRAWVVGIATGVGALFGAARALLAYWRNGGG